MKILFVEDELSKNIPRINRLFSKYLGKSRISRLNDLESDPSGYGATSEEVKAIIDETGIVEADFRFPEALRKVVSSHERYCLFVVDRNLVEADYAYEEALSADPGFSEALYDRYFEREGDYLLYKLAVNKKIDVREKFFFMTAYDAKSEIRNAEGLAELIGHLGDFKTNNFIEKGSEEHLARLKDLVENQREISRIAPHQHHVNLLRKYLGEDNADRFIKVLLDAEDNRRIGDNLNELRQIYQKILTGACRVIPGMGSACADHYGTVRMGAETINWLQENGHINSIIRNHCFSIKIICSDFGGHDHPDRQIFEPGLDTVNALIFALKNVVAWFARVSAKYQ